MMLVRASALSHFICWFILISMYPPIHHPFTHPSIHQPNHPSIHPSTYPPNLSTQSILPPRDPPMPYSHPTNPSPSEPIVHPASPVSCLSDIPLPCWPRFPGGLVLFGICTLVMDVFKTGYYSSFFECQSAIKILHPIIQAVFVIVQVGRGMSPSLMIGKRSGDLSPTYIPPHP